MGGHFEIVELLAKGTYTMVFVAKDLSADRRVAVKTLAPRFLGTSDVAARFERESRALQKLSHPNIVDYVAHGFEGSGAPYLVTELVTGTPSRELIGRKPPLSLAQRGHVIDQLGAAVDHLHETGIVHRDLKWSSVILTSDIDDEELTLKLVDFGVLKHVRATDPRDKKRITAVEGVVGTPAYASPEQIRARGEVDLRADVYSLGVMTYELLTGVNPFLAANAMQTCILHLQVKPVAPHLVVGASELPEMVSTIVLRALEKDRKARFSSVKAFRKALLAAIAQDRKK